MEDQRGKTSSKSDCVRRQGSKGPAEICFLPAPFLQRGLAAYVL